MGDTVVEEYCLASDVAPVGAVAFEIRRFAWRGLGRLLVDVQNGLPTKGDGFPAVINRLDLPASSKPAVLRLHMTAVRRSFVAPPCALIAVAGRSRQRCSNQAFELGKAQLMAGATLLTEVVGKSVVLACHVLPSRSEE